MGYEEQVATDDVGQEADAAYFNHMQKGIGSASTLAAQALAFGEAEAERAKAAEAAISGGFPGITNPGPRTASVGIPIELQIVATNAANYGATGLPAGLTINAATGAITGTPTTAETAEVTVTVTGPGGSSTIVFAWTVAAAAAPTVTKPAAQTAVVGTPVEFQIVSTNTTSYAATSLPAGLTINAANGHISGTPTTAEAPTTTIKVTGPGGTAETTFAWTVSAAPTLPAIRAGEPKSEGTGTTQAAPAPAAGTVVGDLLLMLVQLETNTATLTAGTITALTGEGWTQVGTLGNIGVRNFYVFARAYTGAAMPLLTASVSTTWDVRVISVQGGEAVNVNSGWSNQASSTTLNIASVTTTAANELAIAVTSKPGGTSETTPAGWTAFNTKNQFRVFFKNQAAAEATGATSAVLGVAEASTALTLAITKTAPVTGITEKLSTDTKAVEPVSLPPGAASITAARATAETGQDENTLYEVVPVSTTRMLGTVSHPWMALQALNASSEPIGPYTARIKTTPELLAPTVTKPATQGGNVAKATSFQISATESPTSYAATGLPPGLTVNTGTGLISGIPTTVGTYTPSLTATNAAGTSPAVTFSWVIGAAVTSALSTGFTLNGDETSSATLAALALGPTAVVRGDFGIGTAASTVRERAEVFAAKGITYQVIAGFSGRIATAAEAKGLGAWAAALAAHGVKFIEFGNETNYQVTNNKANGETYGQRAKEAAEAIAGSGIKLLVQVSDAGKENTEWIDGVFAAVPNMASLAAGWIIHPYPGVSLPGEKDHFGAPMMERMVKRLEEKGDHTVPIYVTEWGSCCTATGITLSDGSHRTWGQAAEILEKHRPVLEAASKNRMVQLLLYQNHDQAAEGSTTNREKFFGALTSSGGRKGAFTTFIEAFLKL